MADVNIVDLLNAGYEAVPTEGWAPLKVRFQANIPPDMIYDTEEDNELYIIIETEIDDGQYELVDSE